jgi:hypothetical protein
LDEQLGSQDGAILMLDKALHRGREAAVSDAARLAGMEAEVSVLGSLVGEAAPDPDMVRAAAAEQRLVHIQEICHVEEESWVITVG